MYSDNKCILLAEDEPQVRNMLAMILRSKGYQVLEAIDGREAMKLAEEHKQGEIDLLLTDIVMPYIDGTEVAWRFKNMFPNCPIILMSGFTEDKILQRIRAFKDVEFLPKPFLPNTLTMKIDQLLNIYV